MAIPIALSVAHVGVSMEIVAIESKCLLAVAKITTVARTPMARSRTSPSPALAESGAIWVPRSPQVIRVLVMSPERTARRLS